MYLNARQSAIALLISALVVPAGATYAAALAAPSISISALGNANAGAAAIDDASAQFYNPAALSWLNRQQFTFSLMVADANVNFTNGTSQGTSETIAGAPISGGDEGDPVKATPVPMAYYAYPINDQLTAGLGISAPYTIAGHFSEDWIGRYDGIESQTIALNINPAISWKPTNQMSFGFGVSGQYFSLQRRKAADQIAGVHFIANTLADDQLKAAPIQNGCKSMTDCSDAKNPEEAKRKLDLAVKNIESIRNGVNKSLDDLVGANDANNDGEVAFEGDDFSFGYNLGMMYQPNRSHRFGFAYRSQIKHQIKGKLDWTVSENATKIKDIGDLVHLVLDEVLFVDSKAEAQMTTPATASLHSYHQISPNLSLLSDLTWTEWSVIQEIRVNILSLLNDSLTPANLKNTLRLSLASNYQYSPSLLLRAGYAFDQSPVQDEYRSPSLPDSDRQMLSVGAAWQLSKTQTIDFAGSMILFKTAEVNYNDWAGQDTPPPALGEGGFTGSKHTTRGTFESQAWLLGVQYNHKF
ncbi:OmpP1/FadL family transporter [Pelagibaculum spongiae]|uniref:Aromatic hydrocarbon degradation protein n=1 Tax=Pelagibaculum spongiae TaxID=2080658 RepID=A0A2V1GT81_9GAMM|nr:outer membrane protein transport protein [Pelagibaculum spongiae]PVZ68808.1 hypothetical protein DC094_11155 [Pelagibaculum spongiae]